MELFHCSSSKLKLKIFYTSKSIIIISIISQEKYQLVRLETIQKTTVDYFWKVFFFGLVCSGWNFVKTFRQLFRVQCSMCNAKRRRENTFSKQRLKDSLRILHSFIFLKFHSRLILIENKKQPKTVPDKSIKTLPIIKIMSKQLKTKDGLAAVGFFAPDSNYNLE